MRGLHTLAVALVATGALAIPALVAQQPADPPAAAQESPERIKQELEKIKKGRTLAIARAEGVDDSGVETILRFDNTSPFNLVVLVVGPTTQRIELGPDRIQTLTVEPGTYEIAVTVTGRNLPPFYGRQAIIRNMRFVFQFVIPAV